MQLLEQHIDNTKTVLDVGCGSGILSVSAVLLGAKSAVGCDIDGVAVRTAGENAKLNGVSDRTSFYKGDLTRGITGTYDVICANIVADVIVRLCPDIPQYLKPDGVFVISGIIEERYDNVAEAVEKIGFQIDQTRTSGGWVALTCSRKKKASGGV